ncbi:MAG: single-stranded DNA-binding protein [Defluviitaleaceae bacterium]|nr:single-stranded DNA-binding protein [Defluviitaleaceae bacterium]
MINRVVLVGRLTRDPELRYTTNNIANLRFTVAVNRQFSNQNGERQADFIGCVAWRAQAENMARFLKKGALIGVDGRIETGSYQGQDGQMRYTTDVIADSVQFLEPKSAAGQGMQPGFGGNDGFNGFPGSGTPVGQQPSQPFPTGNQNHGMNNPSAQPFPTQTGGNHGTTPDFNATIDISDDDLPF